MTPLTPEDKAVIERLDKKFGDSKSEYGVYHRKDLRAHLLEEVERAYSQGFEDGGKQAYQVIKAGSELNKEIKKLKILSHHE